MSRLPNATGIPPPRSSRLSKPQSSRASTLPPLRTSKSMRGSLSRSSVSSCDDIDHHPSRFSFSSAGSSQTTVTSPRSSVASPKPQPNQRSLQQTLTECVPALHIGERVAVDSMGIVGTLKFLGPTEFRDGFWAGIQLDIVGTGKNDGTVKGMRYFSCPPQTGIFVVASKVSPLDCDTDSVRSSSSPPPPTPIKNRNSVPRVTNGSRAARYVGMTANQLSQQRRGARSLSLSQSKQPSQSIDRRSLPPGAGPDRRRVSPTVTTNTVREKAYPQHQDRQEEENMLTDTPVPSTMAASKSTDPVLAFEPEDPHARLERVLGEAINQAPGEAVMRLQQLQLRVEVLEAENKFLKLENAQNKTAEQILARSMVLRKNTDAGDEDNYFTLEGHKAIVEEIKQEHETKQKAWVQQGDELRTAIKRLEARVAELETEQSDLIKERDELLQQVSDVRAEKAKIQQKVHDLEDQLEKAKSDAEAAAAEAARAASNSISMFSSEDPEELRRHIYKLELQIEESHEKISSLSGTMRAKDMFLCTLTEQVDMHRNQVEEKEREVRRTRADSERHLREKERLREEVDELEKKWMDHQECASKEQFEKRKREVTQAKEDLAKETAIVEEHQKRVQSLEQSVDELKRAGMETLELYENSVEDHRINMEAMDAQLKDERRKVAILEVEREDLRKAGLDAIEAYEATIEELKKDRAQAMREQEGKRDELQQTIEKLKQEIEQLVNARDKSDEIEKIKTVWDSERKRLEEQVEELERERNTNQGLKEDAARLREQLKESEKLAKEKQRLDEQVSRLQADYDDQLGTRNRYLDDLRAAVESQKKTEADMRRLTEAKEKADRDLVAAQENMARMEAILVELRAKGPLEERLSSEREQHKKDMETLRTEIEKLEAQNVMLSKQKEQAELSAKSQEADQEAQEQWKHRLVTLQSENERLTGENEKLSEAHKQAENECLKLMDEVEKLHSEGPMPEEAEVLPEGTTPEERTSLLQKQLGDAKRQMERLIVKHSSEARQLTQQLTEQGRSHEKEITTLNRDITELESLIESKIFKEADLEEALENERRLVRRLRDDLIDLKDQITQLSKTQHEERRTQTMAATTASSSSTSSGSSAGPVTDDAPYCEICEVPGHDLMSCKPALDERRCATIPEEKERTYCENCDEHGMHDTQQCPNQNEMF